MMNERKVVEESNKADIEVKKEPEDWEKHITEVIFKYFSQKPFCCYDVVKKVLGNEPNRRKFYMWAMRVRKVLKVLESSNKIKFIGWKEGVAPIKKKLYKMQ
jgi:hypothetical protein